MIKSRVIISFLAILSKVIYSPFDRFDRVWSGSQEQLRFGLGRPLARASGQQLRVRSRLDNVGAGLTKRPDECEPHTMRGSVEIVGPIVEPDDSGFRGYLTHFMR